MRCSGIEDGQLTTVGSSNMLLVYRSTYVTHIPPPARVDRGTAHKR